MYSGADRVVAYRTKNNTWHKFVSKVYRGWIADGWAVCSLKKRHATKTAAAEYAEKVLLRFTRQQQSKKEVTIE
jgi:hypothetical protein